MCGWDARVPVWDGRTIASFLGWEDDCVLPGVIKSSWNIRDGTSGAWCNCQNQDLPDFRILKMGALNPENPDSDNPTRKDARVPVWGGTAS